ncbi:transmembrane ascorbate-dependent reductase CYB561-like isoform X1 [Homalodisca vitripennis]|uniref:transmembrane ascorbate-dependent reductase CYB561-like isoform X1 n=1 Tax=Homalodisca vitripennis TaxID=197043 RepID=UPI001EEACE8B|nr:transmembrane ascorbate-dependent reductase CYB561-like isoform X1 [Homalodisca vitripennis]
MYQSQNSSKTNGDVEMARRHSYACYNILFWLTQGVGLLAIILLCIWVFGFRNGLAWNSQPKVQFNWHALCMPIGLIYLCALELMTFRIFRYGKKKDLKLLHAGYIILIVILIVIGYWAILDCHNYQGKPNWYSLHSWMGVLTTALYFTQGILGCASFLWPGVQVEYRVKYKPLHVFMGLTTFIMATTTALLGLFEEIKNIEGYNQFSGEGIMMNLCGISFAIFAVLVVYIQTRPNYRREPLVSD